MVQTGQWTGLVDIDGIQDVSGIPTREKQNVCLAFRGQIFGQTYGRGVPERIEKCSCGPKQEVRHSCTKDISPNLGNANALLTGGGKRYRKRGVIQAR